MNGRPWTNAEKWQLQELADCVSQAEAARRLGRSFYGVTQQVRTIGLQWRGRVVSANRLSLDLGCSGATVVAAAQALGLPATGQGTGRRYLFDALQADRLRRHLSAKLKYHEQQRAAGRRRQEIARQKREVSMMA